MALEETFITRLADGADEFHRATIAERTTAAIDTNLDPETARVTRRIARGIGAFATGALGVYVAYRTGANIKEAFDATFDAGVDIAEGGKALIPDLGETALTITLASIAAGAKAVGTERRPGDPAWSERDGLVQRTISAKRERKASRLTKKYDKTQRRAHKAAAKATRSDRESTHLGGVAESHGRLFTHNIDNPDVSFRKLQKQINKNIRPAGTKANRMHGRAYKQEHAKRAFHTANARRIKRKADAARDLVNLPPL